MEIPARVTAAQPVPNGDGHICASLLTPSALSPRHTNRSPVTDGDLVNLAFETTSPYVRRAGAQPRTFSSAAR